MKERLQTIRTGVKPTSWTVRWWTGPEEVFEERRWGPDDVYETLRRTTSRVMHLFPPKSLVALCGVEATEQWGPTTGGNKGLKCEGCIEVDEMTEAQEQAAGLGPVVSRP